MIEVQGLTKRYGPVTAVNDVTFRVEAGEVLGFLGPNGAGKTTTMRVITGFLPPTEGKVLVAGHDVFEQPIQAKRHTGYLPETPPLYPDMTVRQYLLFVGRIKGVPRREVKGRVEEVMRKTWVADMATRHCMKLSKGYRQRVGLAQAIIHNPDVLILDEPTAGLDPKQRVETRQLIRELGGSHTIVLSSHILSEVAETCHRVVIISKGRVVAIDTPDNLTARLRGAETMFLQVAGPEAPVISALSSVRGVTRVALTTPHEQFIDLEVDSERGVDVRRELASTIVGSGWGLLELRPVRMGLEDIFLKLTEEEAADAAAANAGATAPDTAEEGAVNA
jgi:gliding motility-associated transport system ATP-binding protein